MLCLVRDILKSANVLFTVGINNCNEKILVFKIFAILNDESKLIYLYIKNQLFQWQKLRFVWRIITN